MKKFIVIIVAGVISCMAQQAASDQKPEGAAQPASAPKVDPAVAKLIAAYQSGVSVRAVLDKGINSKNAANGQEVVFRVLEGTKWGNGEIAKDAKIIGHVIHVTAKSKGDQDSVVALDVDTLQGKNGESKPLMGQIQAIAGPIPSEANAPDRGDMATQQVGGGSTGARVDPNAEIGRSAPGGANGVTLQANQQGSGLPGVVLDHALSKNGRIITILATGDKSLKLDGGNQVVIRVAAQ